MRVAAHSCHACTVCCEAAPPPKADHSRRRATCPRPRSRGRCSRRTAASAPDLPRSAPTPSPRSPGSHRPTSGPRTAEPACATSSGGCGRASPSSSALPDGYEIALGNGGTTAFFDLATYCLIEHRSQHCSFGDFSARFAAAAARAPHLEDPEIIAAPPGRRAGPIANDAVDTYALTHNETSTGVAMPVARPVSADGTTAGGLVIVDATSAAGCLTVAMAECDAYYFAPQKGFGSEGGLWLAACSPAAVERSARPPRRAASSRRSSTSTSPSKTPGSTRPTTRRRSPRSGCSPSRSTG